VSSGIPNCISEFRQYHGLSVTGHKSHTLVQDGIVQCLAELIDGANHYTLLCQVNMSFVTVRHAYCSAYQCRHLHRNLLCLCFASCRTEV